MPWDTEVFGFPVASIDRIAVAPTAVPGPALAALRDWLAGAGIGLASCRIESRSLRASMLLESAGFRFIETVYDPILAPLPSEPGDPAGIEVRPPHPDELAALDAIALESFTTGQIGRAHV